MSITKIAIIGTGNVGTWLYKSLSAQSQFAVARFSGRATAELPHGYDLYLFSLKDDCYEEALAKVPFTMDLAAHTSGSVSQHIFKHYASQYGVVYPYQTILKEKTEGIEVPLCIEGCNSKTAENLYQLGKNISNNVQYLNEEQRATLHLAGVFACNFTNAMYRVAAEILEEKNIPFQTIIPLIQHTSNKIKTIVPKEAQTGPAHRNDISIIEKHILMLRDKKSELDIYEMLTKWIQER